MKSSLALILMLAAPIVTLAQSKPAVPKLSASAIQIELIDVGDISIPAEFRYAIYERMIQQVTDAHIFQKVFRSGDQAAKGTADLVTLHTTLDAFKEGNQTTRELVPVVVGTTTVDVSAKLTTPDGKTVLDQKIAGKVRIFGENLGATNDLAKRITKLLRENF